MKQEDAIMLEEYYIESITLSSYDAGGNTRAIALYEEANTVYHKDFSGVSITGRNGNTFELIPMNSIRSITYKNKVQRDMLGNVIEEGE